MSAQNKIDLATISHLDALIAELLAEIARLTLERSKLFAKLGEADAKIRTGRKDPAPHKPVRASVSPEAKAAAQAALRRNVTRRIRQGAKSTRKR